MANIDETPINVLPYQGPWTVIDLESSKQIYRSQAEAIDSAHSLVGEGDIVEIDAEHCVIKLLQPTRWKPVQHSEH